MKKQIPETNWNSLNDYEKEVFIRFYNEMKLKPIFDRNQECPDEFCDKNKFISCNELCEKLFPNINNKCPCHVYEKSAFNLLHRCINNFTYKKRFDFKRKRKWQSLIFYNMIITDIV